MQTRDFFFYFFFSKNFDVVSRERLKQIFLRNQKVSDWIWRFWSSCPFKMKQTIIRLSFHFFFDNHKIKSILKHLIVILKAEPNNYKEDKFDIQRFNTWYKYLRYIHFPRIWIFFTLTLYSSSLPYNQWKFKNVTCNQRSNLLVTTRSILKFTEMLICIIHRGEKR